MSKRTLVILTIVALVALIVVPFVYAQSDHGRHHGMGMCGEGMGIMDLSRARQALGLTDQQVDQLKAIATDLRTQNAPYRDQLKGGREAIAQTLLKNPNDLTAAQSLLDQHSQAERAMKLNALSAASKALNILNADQRAKVGTFLAMRQAHHQDHE